MRIEEYKKKQEEYRQTLENNLKFYEPIAQKIANFDLSSFQNVLKVLYGQQQDSEDSVEQIISQFTEAYNAFKLYYSCVAPLQVVLNTFMTKGKNDLFSSRKIEFDYDSAAHSARDIYKLIIQLPEYFVQSELQKICIENDTDAILDAYKQKNEDGFVKAFEQIKDKQSFKNILIAYSKIIENAYTHKEILEEGIDHDDPKDYMDYLDFLTPSIYDIADSVKQIPDSAKKKPFFQNMISADGFPEIKRENVIKEYKRLLFLYLDNVQKFDDITNEYAERIIQNPEHIEITRMLLDECRMMRAQMEVNNDGNETKEEAMIVPLEFTTTVSIDKNERIMFLTELYNILADKRYVDSNKCDDFVYLLGGGSDCPEKLVPINWLKQKNQLQAFCSVYLNKKTDIEWSKLNLYFTWKGRSPQLSNSCGVIPENFKNSFLSIFEECKKKILKQD